MKRSHTAPKGKTRWRKPERVESVTRGAPEQALRASQARLQSIFRAAPIGIGVVCERVFVEVNDRLCEMLGYTPAELLGQNARLIYPTDEEYDYVGQVKYAQIRAHGIGTVETRFRRKDGSVFDVLLSSAPLDLADGKKGVTFTALDITARKRAEESLRRERDLFSRITETSPAGITIVDREGQITFANARAEQVLGLTKDEITQRTYNAPAWHITDHDGNPFPDEQLPFRHVMSTGKPVYDVRHAITLPDGRRVLLSINAAPLHDALGQVDSVVATVEDATEAILAQEALARAQRDWEDIFQAIGHPTLILDPAHNIIAANHAAQKATGYPITELVRRKCYEVFHGTTQPPAHCPLARLRASAQMELREMEVEALGGVYLVSCTPVFDAHNQLHKVIHIATDISEQKRAEAALRESERKYRMLIEHIPAHTYIAALDEHSTTLFVSPQVEPLTGYTPAEYVAAPALWVNRIHPDDRERVLSELATARAEGKPFISEYRMFKKDGQLVWFRDQATVVCDETGKPLHLQGVMLDITDRKRAEDALREAHDRLLTVLDSIEADIYVADLKTHEILFVNQHMRESFGGNLVGQVCWQVFRHSPQPCPHCTNDKLVDADGNPTGPYIWEGQNPLTQRWYTNYDRAIRWIDGRVVRVQIATDITERKRTEDELRRRATVFTALYDTARDLSAQEDLATLLDAIAARAMNLLGASISEVCLYDPTRDELDLVTVKGYTPPLDRRVQMGEGMAGRVAQTRQPLIVDDYTTWSGRSSKYAETPITSTIQVPMLHRGELIGVLGAGDLAPQSHQFTEADAQLLLLFAAQAASAVYNARLLAETRARAAHTNALNAIVTSANQTDSDLRALLEVALDHTLESLGMEKGGIWITPGVGEELVFTVRGLPEQIGTFARQVVEAQHIDLSGTIAYDDLQTIDRPAAQLTMEYGIRSIVITPLATATKRVGSLSLVSTQPHTWSKEEIALLEAIGRELGTAAERARLFEETNRRLRELEAVTRLSSSLRSAQSPNEILPFLLDESLAALDTDAGSIWLYDQTGGVMRRQAARGWVASINVDTMKLGEGIIGQVFVSGQVYSAREIASDPGTRESVRARAPAGWGGVCMPIRTAQETIATLFVAMKLPREITPGDTRLLTTLCEIAGTAVHRMRLYEQTEQHAQRLAALHTIDQTISASFDLRVTLGILLDQVIAQLRVDAADILLLNTPGQTLDYAAGRGFRSNAITRVRVRLGENTAGRAAVERRTIGVSDLNLLGQTAVRAPLLIGEGFVAHYSAPLIAKGQLKGVLDVFHRTPLNPNREWLDFLETLAQQAAIAIENIEMFEHLQHSNFDLELAYDTTLEGWSRALEMRDQETEGHTRRVAELTVRLARAAQISEAELGSVRRGALLHDIGKMAISDTILLKPGPLTDEEWRIMRQHPTFAYQLLSPIEYLRSALDIPYCHHERWDGTGYPRGLKGEEIPLPARIFALVDVWDAMRSDRPYHARLPDHQVREYICAQAGKHFDPGLVELFLRVIESE